MKILYFAWLRSKTGTASEEVSPPAEVDHGRRADAVAGRPAGRASPRRWRRRAWCAPRSTRTMPSPGDPVRPGDEVAFFPPVTGG